MNQVATNSFNWATLLLRIAVAGLLLFYGIGKIQAGVSYLCESLQGYGLPYATGYLVYVGEVLAPVLVLMGLWTRPAALVMAFNMVMTLVLGHMHELFHLNEYGGLVIEHNLYFLLGSICIALLGPGQWGVKNGPHWWS